MGGGGLPGQIRVPQEVLFVGKGSFQIVHGDTTENSTALCYLINNSQWAELTEQLNNLVGFYPNTTQIDT